MSKTIVDYLIIGQGLAGSLLAWELLSRQKRVLVVDNGKQNASRVAAGLINPVTGMRLVKSTEIDDLLPFAISYYHRLSLYFKQKFYIEQSMHRVLRSDKEVLLAQKRLLQAEYQNYLDKIIASTGLIQSKHGILQQKQTGYLLTKPLLDALKQYFISIKAYLHSEIEYADITVEPCIKWNNIEAKHIIFCQGHLGTDNPWFSALPFRPVKGEIISAKSRQAIPPTLLNFGHWLIPLDSNQFRIGATFDREHINTVPTSEAKDTLLNSLKHIRADLSIESISAHNAGIRPATLDKQPFIGKHPIYSNLIIFNGFGSKGSLQIPWHCKMLVEHLLAQRRIPDRCSINRYHKKLIH